MNLSPELIKALPPLLNPERMISRGEWWRGAVVAYVFFQISQILSGQRLHLLDVRSEAFDPILTAVSSIFLVLAFATYLLVCVQRLRALGLSPWIAAPVVLIPPLAICGHIVVCGILQGRWIKPRQEPSDGDHVAPDVARASLEADLARWYRDGRGNSSIGLDRSVVAKTLDEGLGARGTRGEQTAQHSAHPYQQAKAATTLAGNASGDPNRPRLPGDRLNGRR